MRKFKTWILKSGGLTATCALALGIAFTPAACGIIFHQPKVPQGMSKFIKDRKQSA